MAPNRQYKDRLFKFIFGNPEKKEWTLSLYNAVNGSSYTDAEAIRINTIEDAVIKPFPKANRAEVKGMYITEYDEERTYAEQREEGRAEGSLLMLTGLVKDGMITSEQAAARMGMTVPEFEAKAGFQA